MRFRAHIGHGIEGKRDVESLLIRLSGSGFNAGSGCYACDHNLRDPAGLQLHLEIRSRKCAPCSLRYDKIAGLAIKFRNQIAESLGERQEAGWLLRPTWRNPGDIDQNDREITLTKGAKQGAGFAQ